MSIKGFLGDKLGKGAQKDSIIFSTGNLQLNPRHIFDQKVTLCCNVSQGLLAKSSST
jgi:hypothetical protein